MFRKNNAKATAIMQIHINRMTHTTNEDDLALEYKAAMTAVLVAREMGAFKWKEYKNISESVHMVYYLHSIMLEMIEGGECLMTDFDIMEILKPRTDNKL